MTEGLLVVIAVATAVTAIIQVGVVVFAVRAARQVGDTMQRIERDLKPVVANLHAVSVDIARAASAAASQVERAERALSDLSRSVDSAASTLQGYMSSPITNGLAVIQGLRTAFDVLRGFHRPRKRAQPQPARHDEMFIG